VNPVVRVGAEKGNTRSVLQRELTARQRRGIAAACVDMRAPFRPSIQQWAPNCLIGYVLPPLGAGPGDICGGNMSEPNRKFLLTAK
jgi:hypothetical protein